MQSFLRALLLAGVFFAFTGSFGSLTAQAQSSQRESSEREGNRLAAIQASPPKMLPLSSPEKQQEAKEQQEAEAEEEAEGQEENANSDEELVPIEGAGIQAPAGAAGRGPSKSRRPQARPRPATSSAVQSREEPRRSQVQLAILEARRNYQETGDARIIREGTQLILPFGHNQPTIRTTPMRFTLVKLNKNEFVKKPFIADPDRWDVSYGSAGTQGNFDQYISIKPLRCGLSSNMAFLTNMGRVYNMTFESSDCTGNQPVSGPEQKGKDPYAVQISFYYPDASSAQIPNPPSQAQPSRRPPAPRTLQADQYHSSQGGGIAMGQDEYARVARNRSVSSFRESGTRMSRRVSGLNPPIERGSVSAQMPTVSLEDLSANYAIEADDGFPCEPVAVSDDGRRMFVRYPTEDPGCRFRFPIYAAGPEGTLRLMNYNLLDGNIYVTEGVPRRAMQLYYDEEGDRHTLRIRNKTLTEEN